MSDEHTVMDDAVAELFATLERDAKALAPRFHRAQQVVRDAEAEAAATTAGWLSRKPRTAPSSTGLRRRTRPSWPNANANCG